MTISMTATDANGNTSSCTFMVNSAPDTQAPVITCPADRTVACTTSTVPDYTGMATATDNQDPSPVITQSPLAGSTFTDGMTISMTATDASANSADCTFIVSIEADDVAPSISCPADQVLAPGSSIPDYWSLVSAKIGRASCRERVFRAV